MISSININYLVLLPMYIAKQHSEEMALNSDFQRVSYTGTIVGVVIALCAVGKYLFSENLATLLDYWTNDTSGKQDILSDCISTILQLIGVLIILGPIRREYKESNVTEQIRNCACCKSGKGRTDETEDMDDYSGNHNNTAFSNGAKSGSYNRSGIDDMTDDPKSR